MSSPALDYARTDAIEGRLSTRRLRGEKIERSKAGERISAARLAASKASHAFQGVQLQIDDAMRRGVRVSSGLIARRDATFERMSDTLDELESLLA